MNWRMSRRDSGSNSSRFDASMYGWRFKFDDEYARRQAVTKFCR